MNTEALLLSLWITLIGMAIVFGAIIVLWIGMALLVRVTTIVPKQETGDHFLQVKDESEDARKRYVVAVAVAFALKAREKSPVSKEQFPLPATAFVSAWQAVMRANIFNKRGRVR